MTKGARTKRLMLDAATDLFQRQGLHATGVNQVLVESGAPRGSLYFHFPGGKQQLAAEAVESAGRHVHEQIEEISGRGRGVEDAITEVVELFAALLESSDFRSGCPIATVALEANAENPDVCSACAGAYESWLETLGERFVNWGIDREEAPELATAALSMLEGALLLARVQHDASALRTVGNQLTRMLVAAGAR